MVLARAVKPQLRELIINSSEGIAYKFYYPHFYMQFVLWTSLPLHHPLYTEPTEPVAARNYRIEEEGRKLLNFLNKLRRCDRQLSRPTIPPSTLSSTNFTSTATRTKRFPFPAELGRFPGSPSSYYFVEVMCWSVLNPPTLPHVRLRRSGFAGQTMMKRNIYWGAFMQSYSVASSSPDREEDAYVQTTTTIHG